MEWVYVIALIAAVFIAQAMAPKIKSKPAAFEDFEFPQFEEGSPQEVWFGDVWTESWMVLGTGNFTTRKIRKDGQVVGFRYGMGIHMGLCRGALDEIVEITVGDKTAWSGSIAVNTTITIDQPTLFGGKKREGGIVGPLTVLMGGVDQLAPASLATMLGGGPMPGFRGTTTVFFDGIVSSNSAYPKPWAFRGRRILRGWRNDTPWYPETAVISLAGGSVHAMNPAHIIYQALTDPSFGRGWSTEKLNDAAWRAAAARFAAEGFGLCLRWKRPDGVRNFIQAVLDHTGSALTQDRQTGQYALVPIRGDYDVGSLPLFSFDNGLLTLEDDEASSTSAGVNQVIVTWRNPITNKNGVARARNLAAQQAVGVIEDKVEYEGIPTHELAAQLALRDLKARSGFLKRFKLRFDRRFGDRSPGSCIRISVPTRGIEDMVVRIGTIEDEARSGQLIVKVVQDVFGLDAALFTTDDVADGYSPPATLVPPDDGDTSIAVASATTEEPPAVPVDGVGYLVPPGATGAWATHVGEIAWWNEDEGDWDYTAPTPGTFVWVDDLTVHVAIDETGSAALPPWTSVTTTKGDLIVRGDTADARLPVGADGTVPIADSAQPLGVRWGAPPAGGTVIASVASGVTVYQDADQTVASSTAFVDGTDLVVPVEAGATYAFEVLAFTSSAVGPGLKTRLHFTGSASQVRYDVRANTSGGTTVVGSQAAAFDVEGSFTTTTTNASKYSGTFHADSAGSFSLQFAQVVSSATPATLQAGSMIRLIRLAGGLDIDTEVAADSPRAYWRLDEASGSFADSSGGGYTLAVTGSPVTQYRFTALDPAHPSRATAAILASSQTSYLGHAAALGVALPATTWTFEIWGAWTVAGNLGGIGAAGETSGTNLSFLIDLTAAGALSVWWEYGAGTDAPTLASILGGALDGKLHHLCVTKDAATRTVALYIDGRYVGGGTYLAGQEATGGASGSFAIPAHPASVVAGADGVYSGCAFYTTALSAARVAAHARALRLMP